MRPFRHLCAALILSVSIAACASSGTPASQGAPSAASEAAALTPATTAMAGSSALTLAPSAGTSAPSMPGLAGSSNAFTVAVIADTLSQPVTRGQAQAVISESSKLLRQLTPFGIEMTDFVEDGGGGSTNDMASRYATAHAAALPSGIVIFSFGDGGQAKLAGGYSYALAAPAGFHNSFVSPVMGASQIYVAVVDLGYKYAACGYGGSDAVQGTTALAGECRNQPGTPCVQQNGYSMCADAVGNLYMSTPTYYAASTIIHQLLQPFAPGGDRDHYNTPECNARMGYPPAFFDLQESQYHNDLCPYVYDEFVKSHQP
jgi:hypothetical protein